VGGTHAACGVLIKTISSVTTSAEKRQGLYHTLGWLRGVDAGKLVQHPVVGGIEPLQMLLLTSGHDLFGPFQSERASWLSRAFRNFLNVWGRYVNDWNVRKFE